MRPGLVMQGPDGKEIKSKNEGSAGYYIIWEVSGDAIVLQDLLIADYSLIKEKYKRTEKIEISL